MRLQQAVIAWSSPSYRPEFPHRVRIGANVAYPEWWLDYGAYVEGLVLEPRDLCSVFAVLVLDYGFDPYALSEGMCCVDEWKGAYEHPGGVTAAFVGCVLNRQNSPRLKYARELLANKMIRND